MSDNRIEAYKQRLERMKTVDDDHNWRERNDLAPGIPVHMTLDAALAEARRLKAIYPVVGVSPNHPLGIEFFQSGQDIPGQQIFCYTQTLRDRVVNALVGEANVIRRH